MFYTFVSNVYSRLKVVGLYPIDKNAVGSKIVLTKNDREIVGLHNVAQHSTTVYTESFSMLISRSNAFNFSMSSLYKDLKQAILNNFTRAIRRNKNFRRCQAKKEAGANSGWRKMMTVPNVAKRLLEENIAHSK